MYIPTFTIYALIDPRDATIRYVGCTERDVRNRLSGHVTGARRGRSPSSVWVRELLTSGLRPVAAVLETLHERSAASDAERRWLEELRHRGERLTNVKPGGLTKRREVRFDWVRPQYPLRPDDRRLQKRSLPALADALRASGLQHEAIAYNALYPSVVRLESVVSAAHTSNLNRK